MYSLSESFSAPFFLLCSTGFATCYTIATHTITYTNYMVIMNYMVILVCMVSMHCLTFSSYKKYNTYRALEEITFYIRSLSDKKLVMELQF